MQPAWTPFLATSQTPFEQLKDNTQTAEAIKARTSKSGFGLVSSSPAQRGPLLNEQIKCVWITLKKPESAQAIYLRQRRKELQDEFGVSPPWRILDEIATLEWNGLSQDKKDPFIAKEKIHRKEYRANQVLMYQGRSRELPADAYEESPYGEQTNFEPAPRMGIDKQKVSEQHTKEQEFIPGIHPFAEQKQGPGSHSKPDNPKPMTEQQMNKLAIYLSKLRVSSEQRVSITQ